jgi:hypothetical protein
VSRLEDRESTDALAPPMALSHEKGGGREPPPSWQPASVGTACDPAVSRPDYRAWSLLVKAVPRPFEEPMSADHRDLEILARADAMTKVLPCVVAELVKRLPPKDRRAIEAMLESTANALGQIDHILGEKVASDPSLDRGIGHMHRAARELLNQIAEPPAEPPK